MGVRGVLRRAVVVISVPVLLLLSPAGAWAAPGDPDTSFSSDGFKTIDFPGGVADFGRAALVQSDGKIVLGGTSADPSTYDFGVVRLLAGGSVDTSFSGDGFTSFDFLGSGGYDEIYDLAQQPDGKIVAVGYAEDNPSTGSGFAIARFKKNGTLDPNFSGDGMARFSFPGYDYAYGYAVELTEDGKILVGGEVGNSGDDDWRYAVIRVKSGGSIDNSFSSDGRVTTNFSPRYEGIWRMALQPDGKLVVGGWGYDETGTNEQMTFARYKTGGSLDQTFSGDGKLMVDLTATGADYVEGLALRPDGKIVADGFVAGTPNSIGLVRIKSGGGLDTSFSGDGKLVTNPTGDNIYIRGLELGDGNDLVVTGAIDSPMEFFVARYEPGGGLDTTFGGGDGYARDMLPGASASNGYSSTMQPNGRILVVGSATVGSQWDFAVARYLP